MEHRKSRWRTSAFLKFIAVILAVICFATCFFSAALTITAIKTNVYNDDGAKLLDDSIAGRTESLLYAFTRSLWYGNYEYVTEEETEDDNGSAEKEQEWSIGFDGKTELADEPAPTLVLAEPKRLDREQLDVRLPNSIRPENSAYLFVIRDGDGQIVYSTAEITEDEIGKGYERLAYSQPLTLKVRDLAPTELHCNWKSLGEVEEMLGVYRHFTGKLNVLVDDGDGGYTEQTAVLISNGELDDRSSDQGIGIGELMICLFADRMLEEDDLTGENSPFLSVEYNDFRYEYSPYYDEQNDEQLIDAVYQKQAEFEAYEKWASERYYTNRKTLSNLYDDFYRAVCAEFRGTARSKYISAIPSRLDTSAYFDSVYAIVVKRNVTLSYDLVGTYYAYPEQAFTTDIYYSPNSAHGDSIQYTADAVEFIARCARMFPLLMLSSGLLLLILLFYLVFAAGERRGHETAVACWFDMIPLELFAIVDLTAAVYLVQDYLMLVYDYVFTNYSTHRLVVLAALAVVPFGAGLVGVLSLMTLSTRIKAHVVLKYSFVGVGIWLVKSIWKLINRLGKLVSYLFKKIPLAWQCAVAVPALMFADLILVLGISDGADPAVFVWFMMWVAVGLFTLTWCIGFKRVKKYAKGMKNGDISKEIDKKYLFGALKEHAEELEGVDEGIKKAVDERMKSERFKTELIANVSHDLKTPLTSIVNYVDILSKDEIESPEAREHIDVLKRQAARMKKLIEDLVEVSKASSGTISASVERTDVNLLVTQTATEYAQRFEDGKLELVMNMPEKKQIAELDGRLMWRVLDNLCNNICKYALAGTRVYITAEDLGESVRVSFKNISRFCLNMTGDELMERFVRGDSSRNTEGSGLGLSIAKSFCDLQKVGFDIVVDGDLFKVSLTIPKTSDVEPDDAMDSFAEQEAAFRASQRTHTVEEEPESEEILPIRESLPPSQNEPLQIEEKPHEISEAELSAPKTAENDENPVLFDEKEGTTEE